MAKRAKRDERALIFPSEKVKEAKIDLLVKLLRMFYNKRQITGHDFISAHTSQFIRETGSAENLAMDRNNLRKRFDLTEITWGSFRSLTERVFRLDLISIAVTFRDPVRGEVFTISTDDPIDEDPPPPNEDIY